MKKVLFLFALCFSLSVLNVCAQLRPAEKVDVKTNNNSTAPSSMTAKYEGGMFGYDKKQEGTLKFDDVNERLVFFGKDNKEQFAIPYKAVTMVYTGTKSVRSGAGTAVSVIPLPGAGLAGLIREKRRYLVIQFSDPDVIANGVANFKLENDQIRESAVHALGGKAKLTQRGDAYYRPRPTPTTEL